MLKILQARLQQYVNWGITHVQAGFRKDRGTRDQIANICWIIEKAKELQKNIYFCFIYYVKAFDCADCNKLWKILKEIGISDHLTCLLRNLMWINKQQLEPDMEQWTSSIGKGVQQGCLSLPCLFIFNAEHILWNVRLDESQAEIKIAKRYINNLKYADDTNLMAESE